MASQDTLAVNGGSKAIAAFESEKDYWGLKVGLDEFLALADTWGYSRKAQDQIRTILAAEEEAVNPHLSRYYNPAPSRVDALEAAAREIFGSRYAVAVNSGTSALMSAYVAAGVGPGTEVIVPAYTFYATAAAVVASKGIPVIAEIDDSLTIDPADVERKITPHTKAIAPVHMIGVCCDMDAIMDIASRHDVLVIEDNAQSCGGKFHDRYLGTFGALGCFSLSTYKIVGAGEGGLVLTDDEYLYIRALSQHDTGACWRPQRFAKERMPGELFAGQNYKMSELEGAVNLVQLGKMQELWGRYHTNYRRVLSGLDESRSTRVRRSNDLDGDVGYTLVLLARDREAAGRLAEALTAEGVRAGSRGIRQARDWHIYAFWEQILEQKTPTDVNCPYECPYYEGPLPDYREDMCTRSLDIMDRAVFISVNQFWTENDCAQVAGAINKVCDVLG